MTEDTESLRPDDAFTLLADRTRIKIIRALGDASTPGVPETLPFSELRRRADISGSGRFNYHLKQLLGQFVEETADGYRLSYPGVRVYQAMKAGTFTERVRIDPFELDAACHVCGATQVADYRDSMFRIRCRDDDCGAVFYKYFCPPSSLTEREREGVLRAVNERIQREIASMANGVCPWCCGRMASRVLPPDAEMPQRENPAIEHRVLHTCDTCDGALYTRLGGLVVTHPAVVSFFYDHAIDVTRRHVWSLPFAASDERTTVTGTDPWRATVRVGCAGDTLRLRIDEGPSVVEATRVD
ncbi:ArsR family transcriptional regulator [Haloplanus rallus]|uniref:ArsR family transcriptional regulator n=1 Tax=Haloplanus rallus TaxID=1816183 RepID=A0A6B9FED6_9EURY|nr:helix-turn-helix domain-containing protein [Haloplanus rallus]QGX95130.1 ArsR family transcriptional regulator [Haloplanus rallus]